MNDATPSPKASVASNDKPPTDRIHRKRDADHLLIWTQPHGYVKGSFGLGILGPALIGMGVVIPWRVYEAGGSLEPAILAWCSILAAGGGLIALLAMEMGSSHHRLEWSKQSGVLKITRASRFRRKRWELPRAQMTGLSMVEADFTAQTKPVYCLQIEHKAGRPIKVMTARPDSELKWVVAQLGQAMDA